MPEGHIIILIVDDESRIRNLMRRVLQQIIEGVKVLEAENGKEGLQVLSEKPVDLVITDLMMPVMNGAEMVEELVRIENKVPVIFHSGGSQHPGTATRMENLIRSGRAKFLSKPHTRDELIALLQEQFPFLEIERD